MWDGKTYKEYYADFVATLNSRGIEVRNDLHGGVIEANEGEANWTEAFGLTAEEQGCDQDLKGLAQHAQSGYFAQTPEAHWQSIEEIPQTVKDELFVTDYELVN